MSFGCWLLVVGVTSCRLLYCLLGLRIVESVISRCTSVSHLRSLIEQTDFWERQPAFDKNMNEECKADDMMSCCASCGIAEVDDIQLVPCDSCDLVKYCNDECQRDHKVEHEEDCKKRAAELRDELLFKQPESSYMGDCPICSLPLVIGNQTAMMMCCSKLICFGCNIANQQREKEMRLQHTCPFCREPLPKTNEEDVKRRIKRVEMNDPVAMRYEGTEQYMKGDYSKAFEYWTKAAEMGDALAHFSLSTMYRDGDGVEKDGGKMLYHAEEAALAGHPDARHRLGAYEWNNNRNAERAVRHWIIAVTLGYDTSIKALMQAFKQGLVKKDELTAALRAHQAAVDATKSPQREAVEKAIDEFYGEKI